MNEFLLTWTTPPGQVADLREGVSANLPLSLRETYEVAGTAEQGVVVLGDDAARVIRVEINGVNALFTRNATAGTITLSRPLTAAATLRLTLTPRSNFVLLNGALPPGLSLTPAGRITGRVGNLLNDQTVYTFTVRATSRDMAADRTFFIHVQATSEPVALNPEQLLPASTEPVYQFVYRSLGSLDLGQTFTMSLDVLDPNGDNPNVEIHSVDGFGLGETKYGGLPAGLKLSGHTIAGSVDSGVCPGQYFFDVVILNGSTATSARFMIEVTPAISATILAPQAVTWNTPAGSLGTVEETEPCYFAVSAKPRNAALVIYSLAPNSAPLPDGITMNQNTGVFYGTFPYVASNTEYSFIVRATVGTVYAERTFSFTIRKRFDIKNIHHVRLRLRATENNELMTAYKRLIPTQVMFRPEDANFGSIVHPFVYMMNGLDGSVELNTALAGNGVDTVTNRDYHAKIRLILGQHKVALARNSAGQVVYEVLYRELYDRQAGAGGFKIEQNQPIRQNVYWPQSGNTPHYIMPASLVNMRYDLVRDIGFATSTESTRFSVGQTSPELMPLWMRSVQADGDVPGFRPVLFLAYLRPGQGAKMLETLRVNDHLLMNNGHVYQFNRYYTSISQTTNAIEEAIHLE